MILRLLSFAILIHFTTLSYGQQTDDIPHFYKRFEGKIGNQFQVTANLLHLFNKVSGNYQVHFMENGKLKFAKLSEFEGDLSEDFKLSLREFGSKTPTFTGVLNKSGFKGDWLGNPKEGSLAFEMTEGYPMGSLPFDVYYLRSEGELAPGESNTPVAEVEFTLIYPSDDETQAVLIDSVKNIITRHFFGKQNTASDPDTMLAHAEKAYLSNYIDQNKNWHEGGASFSWEKVINMQILHNSDDVLCLEYTKYAYTGGAHGMMHSAYDIISLQDGSLLTYESIFDSTQTAQLSLLLNEKIREKYQIAKEVSLTEFGFFTDKVQPNHNIYVTGSGIGFLYNSYEIAPYAFGTTNIFLEFKEIQAFLRKAGLIYKMATP